MRKIRKEDDVIIIAGRDKGSRGKVERLLDGKRVLVSGVNMIKKHQKPNPQAGVAGGIIEKEAPLQISNIAIFNPVTQKADRVGFKVDGGKKLRVFKSNGEAIDG